MAGRIIFRLKMAFLLLVCQTSLLAAWVDQPIRDADYLVLLHQDLYAVSWMDPLGALLEGRGFQPGYLIVEEGNHYSLVRDAVVAAYNQGRPVRYVLLVGNGKNLPSLPGDPDHIVRRGRANPLAQASSGNYIPYYYEQMEAWDPGIVYDIPSDDGYIRGLSANGEVAIGRIPASSIAELKYFIPKLQEYYASLSVAGTWKQRELFIGFDVDTPSGTGWKVRATTDSVLKHTPSYIQRNILYASEIDPTYGQSQIREARFEEALNTEGAFLINIFATGSAPNNFGFFYFPYAAPPGDPRSAYNFANTGRCPFLLGSNCDLGELCHPTREAVVHDLLFLPTGGAGGIIGAFAPTLMTSAYSCREFAEDFHRLLFDQGLLMAGDLARETKEVLEARMPDYAWNSRSMVLFGDPAIPLALIGSLPSAQGLSAVGHDGEVRVTWQSVIGAGYYRLYRGSVPGFPLDPTSFLGESPNLAYTDATVANASVYYYVVTASNNYGEGQPSQADRAQPRELGDIDANGCVSSRDVLLLEEYLAGRRTFDEEQRIAADLDGNGQVTCQDLELLRDMVENNQGIYIVCNRRFYQWPPSGGGDFEELRIGLGSGAPGTVGNVVPRTLDNDSAEVKDLLLQVRFDQAALALSGYSSTARTEGMNIIGPACPEPLMPDPVMIKGDGETGVRTISLGSGPIANLRVDVAGSAPAGRYHLNVMFASTFDRNDEEVFFIPLRGKFYVPQMPQVSILATPVRDTLLARGDTLFFHSVLRNTSTTTKTPKLCVWGSTVGPNQFTFLAVDTVHLNPLAPGAQIARITGLEVPQGAPEGHYTFTVYAEDSNTDSLYDLDPFGFRVSQIPGKPERKGREETLASEGGSKMTPWEIVSGWFGEGEESQVEEMGSKVRLPKAFALSQNYPNPFNPSTTIDFAVPEREKSGVRVVLEIYNMRGQLQRTLVNDVKQPGWHRAHWDGKDNWGKEMASGVYLYRIVAGDFRSSRKLLLIR